MVEIYEQAACRRSTCGLVSFASQPVRICVLEEVLAVRQPFGGLDHEDQSCRLDGEKPDYV